MLFEWGKKTIWRMNNDNNRLCSMFKPIFNDFFLISCIMTCRWIGDISVIWTIEFLSAVPWKKCSFYFRFNFFHFHLTFLYFLFVFFCTFFVFFYTFFAFLHFSSILHFFFFLSFRVFRHFAFFSSFLRFFLYLNRFLSPYHPFEISSQTFFFDFLILSNFDSRLH